MFHTARVMGRKMKERRRRGAMQLLSAAQACATPPVPDA